jgi:hypothetical protein
MNLAGLDELLKLRCCGGALIHMHQRPHFTRAAFSSRHNGDSTSDHNNVCRDEEFSEMKKDEGSDGGARNGKKVVEETIPILHQLSDTRHVIRHVGISTTSRLATSAPHEFTRV